MREVHHGRRTVLLATVAMLTSGALPAPVTTFAADGRRSTIPGCANTQGAPSGAPLERTRPAIRPTAVVDIRIHVGRHHRRDRDAASATPCHSGPSDAGSAGPGHSRMGHSVAPWSPESARGRHPPAAHRPGARMLRAHDRPPIAGVRVGAPRGRDRSSVSLVDRRTRAELGVWQIDPRTTALAANHRATRRTARSTATPARGDLRGVGGWHPRALVRRRGLRRGASGCACRAGLRQSSTSTLTRPTDATAPAAPVRPTGAGL